MFDNTSNMSTHSMTTTGKGQKKVKCRFSRMLTNGYNSNEQLMLEGCVFTIHVHICVHSLLLATGHQT
jgi:hypothetical protein